MYKLLSVFTGSQEILLKTVTTKIVPESRPSTSRGKTREVSEPGPSTVRPQCDVGEPSKTRIISPDSDFEESTPKKIRKSTVKRVSKLSLSQKKKSQGSLLRKLPISCDLHLLYILIIFTR